MVNTWIVLLSVIGLFAIPNAAFAQESDEIVQSSMSILNITEDERSINVYIAPTNNARSNGEVMISSATIIGFVGLGSFVSAALIGHETRYQVKLFAIALILLTALIIIHLIVIGAAYLDILYDHAYSIIIITTMFLVAAIVTCFILLTSNYLSFKYRSHFIETTTDSVINDILNEYQIENESEDSKENNNDDDNNKEPVK